MLYIIIAVNSYLLANYFQSWIIFEYYIFCTNLGFISGTGSVTQDLGVQIIDNAARYVGMIIIGFVSIYWLNIFMLCC